MTLILPRRSLDIDFLADSQASGDNYPTELSKLDPILAFARAAAGTRVNSAGLIEQVAAGQPRFDFDPVTLRPRGILVEGARTNSALHSGNFGHAVYAGIAGVVTPNYAVAPDGAANAARYVSGLRFQTVAVSVGQVYTVSLWARAVAGTANVGCYDVNGTSQPGVLVGTAWQRISYTGVASSTQGFVGVNGTTGDVLLWGAQIEAGAFATTYIPTTSAPVTRPAENLYVPILAPWLNAGGGTIVVEFDAQTPVVDYEPIVWRMGAGFYQYQNNNGNALCILNGAQSLNVNTGAPLASGMVHRIAISVQAGRLAGSVNGSSVAALTGYDPSPLSMLQLGSYNETFHHINGHIRRFSYTPGVHSDLFLKGASSAA